ncbi:MAG: D-alanine--D-alanine ligase [Planctomycetota bacterium]|jgi:D-alanine-D-alanine ligase
MGKKLRVAILFGGRSAEHEVSLQSAKNVVAAMDKDKYELVLIGIDKKGRWYLNDESKFLLHADDPKMVKLAQADENLAMVPGRQNAGLIVVGREENVGPIDVVFPVLHGPFGEDGTVQGLLKLANVPFVGAGVLGSAAGMDKDVMKRLLRDAGIPIADFLVFKRSEADKIDFGKAEDRLGLPLFVKPANLGSSVGISKVDSEDRFQKAVSLAFEYDNKILVEEHIAGREIECSVLGNDSPIASVPGEVVLQRDFYSYEAKYIDEAGATIEIPAKFSDKVTKKVQDCAIKTFGALCCEGMARVDLFVKENNDIVVNEINTIPGFTKISMYPKLWAASGISYSELIDRLIQLALKRFDSEQQLRTNAFGSQD